MPVSDVPRSAREIHLPQLLNEEAIALPPPLSHPLPSALTSIRLP